MSFHGLLLINKESGMTSHDVVARLRKILGIKSVGHSGTLDPLASGLMVMLLGEATKLSQYILEKNKSYIVKAQLGVETDSFDTTGKVLRTSAEKRSLEQVCQEALKIHGPMELEVPIFSAMKVDGKKLYEYARADESVEIPKKIMHFYDIEILEQGEDWVRAAISCTKGSFIRSWVQLLGKNLGVGAVMSELQRTSTAPYYLSQAIGFNELSEYLQSSEAATGNLEGLKGFVPMSAVLPDAPIIRISGQDQVMIGNGLISHQLRNQLIGAYKSDEDSENLQVIKILSREGVLLALVGLEKGKGFVIRRVFRY